MGILPLWRRFNHLLNELKKNTQYAETGMCMATSLIKDYDCIDKSLILRIASQRSCSRVSPPGSVVAKRMPLACSNLQPLGIRSFCTERFAKSSINSAKWLLPRVCGRPNLMQK